MPGFNCGSHDRYTAGCPGCRRVDSHYDRTRRRKIAEGTWLYPKPAETIRAHVRRLQQSGMSLAAISRAANVAPKTLYTAMREPRKTLRGPTAAALLSVKPMPSLPANQVPSAGCTRRIRALMAIGYSMAELGRQLGKHLQAVWELAWERQPAVTVDTHNAVVAVYERLSTTPGPSVRARNAAKRNGWLPPLAWDDDIDDPNAQPNSATDSDSFVDDVAVARALRGERIRLTRLERHHAVHRGVAAGMALQRIADALHLSYHTTFTLSHEPLPADDYELAA